MASALTRTKKEAFSLSLFFRSGAFVFFHPERFFTFFVTSRKWSDHKTEKHFYSHTLKKTVQKTGTKRGQENQKKTMF